VRFSGDTFFGLAISAYYLTRFGRLHCAEIWDFTAAFQWSTIQSLDESMKTKTIKKIGGLAAFLAANLMAHADSTVGPIQWSIADGGNGFYYECFGLNETWTNAEASAQTQTLTLDGTTYHGILAPVTSAAEASFLQANLVEPSAGDWTITWTGNYVNNGTVYAGDQTLNDTSWFSWSPYTSYTPSDTIGQSGDYGVAITGMGYGSATQWILRGPSEYQGSYLVVFEVTPAPEPSTLALAGLGGLGLLLFRRGK
jgi:hypothetical protein